ncbi:hypothetical protein ACFFYR_02030 [Paraburkholderia dipogonis]|uniref:hypothetical protein n=1 Tax=Paraburkholderia dipogonis TaxID=1211383 RepID=UPI0035EDC375
MAYAQRYPDVSINAVYVDRTTRLLEEGVDVAIRIGHWAIRRSMPFRWVLYGVEPTRLPRISRRMANPFIPRELADHHCVSLTGVTNLSKWDVS